MPGGDGHRGKSLKLLEKIPEDAEATVVLVGKEGSCAGAGAPGGGCLHCGLLVLNSGLQAASSILTQALTCLSSSSQPVMPPALCSPVLCLPPFHFSAILDNASPYRSFVRIRKKHPFLKTLNFHLLVSCDKYTNT